ncbi:uncharacterized protein LOC123700390 [Colias croceus]|nr:uncharacterized protein LOC123692242 [Colias croceus]XP_045503548.1 uncharacterized protein LOC123700390 [Colias croceus]
MECIYNPNTRHRSTISLQGKPLNKVSQFKYLGSMISSDANIDADVTHRINVAWQKWRSLTGVLCDPKMPIKTKGKVYKTAVRPALMYGSECWAIKKAQEQRVHVNEMKMLRWAAGVTRLDKVRNEYIRGSFKVAPISEKLTEQRLRWYGHVMRREENHVVRRALNLPNRRRGLGRPPATWWSTISKDMERAQLNKQTTQDRPSWRMRTRRADPK